MENLSSGGSGCLRTTASEAVAIDQFRKATASWPTGVPLTPPTCPNCGYCPHCGRSGWFRPYPTYPVPFYTTPVYGTSWQTWTITS